LATEIFHNVEFCGCSIHGALMYTGVLRWGPGRASVLTNIEAKQVLLQPLSFGLVLGVLLLPDPLPGSFGLPPDALQRWGVWANKLVISYHM